MLPFGLKMFMPNLGWILPATMAWYWLRQAEKEAEGLPQAEWYRDGWFSPGPLLDQAGRKAEQAPAGATLRE